MDDSNNRQGFQQRFLIAIVACALILAGWTYFFPPPKPAQNANTAANADANQASANTNVAPQQTIPAQPAQQTQPGQTTAPAVPAAPQKIITVESELYKVQIDTRGAVPISWILKESRTSDGIKKLTSIASTKDNPVPLELISQKGLETTPREVPLRILTGDPSVDTPVNENTYQVNAESDTLMLKPGEIKTIEFTQTDASGLEVSKKYTFHADSSVSDLQVKMTKGGQNVPNTKLVVGPSISDQGVKKHHFYRFESEAIAYSGDTIDRKLPSYIKTDSGPDAGRLPVPGMTDWAAIGDAYFAMAVVPPAQSQGAEFVSSKYEVEIPAGTKEGQTLFQWLFGYNDAKETRHLTSALIPITPDDSKNKVFVGAKDHFAFADVNKQVNEGLGRTVDLEHMINYGWYEMVRFFLRPIAVPILWCLSQLNHLTGSYGLAIVIFTIALYSLLFPLKLRSAKAMKSAQKHQPRMKEIQDQMKKLKSDDPKMRDLQMEQLRLMKDANFIGGCLPMLLQVPFFIALYTAITISVDFRQAAFMWFPDLSAADPLHLLEFGMAGSMVLTMVFAPMTPAMTPEQQMQQKMMAYMMPVMMLYLLWGAPAGLLLYWFIGNLVTFGQQMVINRMNKTPDAPAEEDKNDKTTSKKMKPKLMAS